MELEAYKVDAFTSRAYGGNPAGVVPAADGLSDAQMQTIAREMNLSETAFVLPPTSASASHRLRYFTPTMEIPLCGHATIATFHTLVETGRLKSPAKLQVETNVGVLPLDVRDGPEVYLTSDPIKVHDAPLPREQAGAALGLAPDALDADLPVLVVRDDLYVPVRGLQEVGSLRPDMARLEDLTRDLGLQGVVALTMQTHERDALTHIRYFAPAIGIPEDPVTGVAHMGLARYLLETGSIKPGTRFVGEQGHFVRRPGRVLVEVDGDADMPTIRVGGRAVTTLRGTMRGP